MHFDLHLRAQITRELEALAARMKVHQEANLLDDAEKNEIERRITLFSHSTDREHLTIAGVDGSGDYPALGYADSFVYFSVAHGTIYDANNVTGLKERGPAMDPLFHFTWLPEEANSRIPALLEAFAHLAGASVESVVQNSDYREIKASHSGKSSSVDVLIDSLLLPHASDSGNVGIQLRSTAELGMAVRLIQSVEEGSYVFFDSTFSLPLVTRKDASLFFEHLKRYCCSVARDHNVCFLALSKSHGLPSEEVIADLARNKGGLEGNVAAEHWYLRLPVPTYDEWKFPLVEGRMIPPPETVSYLVRFHKTTPVMRLDLDLKYWLKNIQGNSIDETITREQKLFGDLDYASHDQRCYGYPYPIKAGHDRASLTRPERLALRKQIIDMAVRAGMNRALFKDPSLATGHG